MNEPARTHLDFCQAAAHEACWRRGVRGAAVLVLGALYRQRDAQTGLVATVNAALARDAGGLADSTLRDSLKRLEAAGLVRREPSARSELVLSIGLPLRPDPQQLLPGIDDQPTVENRAAIPRGHSARESRAAQPRSESPEKSAPQVAVCESVSAAHLRLTCDADPSPARSLRPSPIQRLNHNSLSSSSPRIPTGERELKTVGQMLAGSVLDLAAGTPAARARERLRELIHQKIPDRDLAPAVVAHICAIACGGVDEDFGPPDVESWLEKARRRPRSLPRIAFIGIAREEFLRRKLPWPFQRGSTNAGP